MMTPLEFRRWKQQWKAINELDISETRGLTFEQKVEDLSELMAWARSLPPRDDEVEIDAVRQRWIKIKRATNARRRPE